MIEVMSEGKIIGARRDQRSVGHCHDSYVEMRSLRFYGDIGVEKVQYCGENVAGPQYSMAKLVIGNCSTNMGSLSSQSGIDLEQSIIKWDCL
jgi:hypothetical protein